MTHYISVTVESGQFSNTMVKAPLLDVLKEALLKAPDDKMDCWLVASGYSDKGGRYTRAEHNFDYMDTVLIDCDNPASNPNVVDEWNDAMKDYDWFFWETASSTNERPKFRAILLLDDRLKWVDEPAKFTKRAVNSVFAKWNDDNASWFFTPTKSKLGTFRHHLGKPYPSKSIESVANLQRQLHEALSHSAAHDAVPMFDRRNPDGWRRLPSVKKCLEGLEKGERDNALCKACYAMDKLGYRSNIQQFLDEVDVPNEMKVKFSGRYR